MIAELNSPEPPPPVLALVNAAFAYEPALVAFVAAVFAYKKAAFAYELAAFAVPNTEGTKAEKF